MHTATGPLPVTETRLPVKELEGLPPVSPIHITWTHICTEVTRGMWVRMFLKKATISAAIALTMTVGYSWAALLVGPLPLLATLAGILWGIPWIGWVVAAILLWPQIEHALATSPSADAVRGRLGGKVGDCTAMTEALAIEEEHWFREGAEHWTWRQRLDSHLVFMRAHPVKGPVFGWYLKTRFFLMSVILMQIYLRVYRRTKSREQALRAASIRHYQENAFIERGYDESLILVWGVSFMVGILLNIKVL